MKKAVGSVWNNMKTTWQKTIYARTTRKVAGRVVRKTSRAVAKSCVLNITSEVGFSTVVATGALMHSKFYQRVMLAK